MVKALWQQELYLADFSKTAALMINFWRGVFREKRQQFFGHYVGTKGTMRRIRRTYFLFLMITNSYEPRLALGVVKKTATSDRTPGGNGTHLRPVGKILQAAEPRAQLRSSNL